MPSDVMVRLQDDLGAARKERDKARTVLLSTTLAECKNRAIELGRELSDDDAVAVITKALKQRREAALTMAEAGRDDLASKEESEAEMLVPYLPEQLSEAEVREMVRAIIDGGAGEIGPLMGQLMPKLKGRFDGREANRIVREELGG